MRTYRVNTKYAVEIPTDTVSESGVMPQIRTHREIADCLGIGRARVYFLEHQALDKIRSALADIDVSSIGDFENSRCKQFGRLETHVSSAAAIERFSSQHGWLSVDKIVSLNDGSESVTDVVLAFRFLKERHEHIMRPPLFVKGRGRDGDSVIQALAEHDGHFYVRCWPTGKRSKRTVADLTGHRCTVIVESEFGTDERGDFDIPILLCVILTHGRDKCSLLSKEC